MKKRWVKIALGVVGAIVVIIAIDNFFCYKLAKEDYDEDYDEYEDDEDLEPLFDEDLDDDEDV